MATIKEVAKLAGVSKATVSRVINGNAYVSSATNQAVTRAMEQLNFSPNTLAQNLAFKRSGSVGVLVLEISSPFYAALLKGIGTAMEPEGMNLMIQDGNNDVEKGKKAIDFLLNKQCDALVICCENIPEFYLHSLIDQGIQLIIINRHLPEILDHCVYLDNAKGAGLAVQYLIDHGHRRIMYLSGPIKNYDNETRFHKYKDVLNDNGIEFDENLVSYGNFTEEEGYLATQTMLEKKIPFTAIFSANDQMAAGAMTALRDANLRIPQDVSIIGFDNMNFARFLYPPLTTIRQPLVDMGKIGTQILLHRLKKKSTDHLPHEIQPELVERESVARI